VIDRTPIATARLVLEPVEAAHADGLWQATETSLAELRRWLVWAEDASADTTAAFTHEAVRDWDEGIAYQFAMVEEDEVVGAIGIDVLRPIHRLGDLGYWIRTDRAGRGLTSEAGRAIVEFGFSVLGLHRLELRAGVDNVASQRVASKLGFRQEGRLREGCRSGTAPYDCVLFGLLATDPRTGPTP
jgi:RimJ/RimL family protein N-acetyltransferase